MVLTLCRAEMVRRGPPLPLIMSDASRESPQRNPLPPPPPTPASSLRSETQVPGARPHRRRTGRVLTQSIPLYPPPWIPGAVEGTAEAPHRTELRAGPRLLSDPHSAGLCHSHPSFFSTGQKEEASGGPVRHTFSLDRSPWGALTSALVKGTGAYTHPSTRDWDSPLLSSSVLIVYAQGPSPGRSREPLGLFGHSKQARQAWLPPPCMHTALTLRASARP